jgi:F0F1-type ATP synthase epsilon subunit
MKMKVKELIELLKTMNQESIIYVAGGFTEYATKDVSVFENGDRVNIQEK